MGVGAVNGVVPIRYTPSTTLSKFHKSKALVRAVAGPVGSGKSVGMMLEILLKAIEQNAIDGVRESRWAVVRTTYAELKNTTLKTWGEWVPSLIAPIVMSAPPTCVIAFPLADGTRLRAEVVFLALDREEDQEKLRSFELTGIYFNEAQFIDPEIMRVGQQRTGRYPKVKKFEDGSTDPRSGPTWSGMILDFNMVDTEHHLYKIFKEERREGWELFTQPAAIIEVIDPSDPEGKAKMWVGNPLAENIENLANPANGNDGYRYYLDKISGMKRSQILVDFCAEWGVTSSGQPVYAEAYDDDVHVSLTEVKADKGLPLLVGMDFGLHPAVVFGQVQRNGTLIILGEIDPCMTSGVALETLIDEYYLPYITEHFNGVKVIYGWGDPAGQGRSDLDKDKRSRYVVLAQNGINLTPTKTNAFLARKEAVEGMLLKRRGLLLNPSCSRLRRGFLGKYGYGKVNGIVKATPEKNEWSHIHDALQYLIHGLLNEHKPVKGGGHQGKGVAF